MASRLRLKFVKDGPGDEKIYRCPFCGDSIKHPDKGHLYINTARGTYSCKRCGEEGNSITLWAKYHGIDNKKAYAQLCENVKAGPPPVSVNSSPQKEIADIRIRDRVYRQFLKLLPLYPEHKSNLLARGLSELQIHNNLYRSIPQEGKDRWKIARCLVEKGYPLEGIPGFFTRSGKYGVFWDFVNPNGYLIPVRDVEGRIQAIQVRTGEGYAWFSSHGMPNGTSSGGPAHFTGGKGRVWITEGPLKADVASCLMKVPFIGVPGVNSYRQAFEALKALHARDPVVAFDSDYLAKKEVAASLEKFIDELKKQGYVPQKCTWSPSLGKGIDDALLKLMKKEVASLTFMVGGRTVRVDRTVTTTVSVS
ncbi:MAG: DUF3854 domain-containing protein [Peptococcaceae bacterium]|nr:DUF3854 domain-containing protein [Peptococcaceae bacterium]